MKIQPIYLDDVEQNSREWDELHLGALTASSFSDMMAGGTGVTRNKLLWSKATERLTGRPALEKYTNWQMQRGHDQEARARDLYRFITGSLVTQTGFVWANELKRVGCSPDGLVGEDGLIEIKAQEVHIHTPFLLKVRQGKAKVPSAYRKQVQGQLMVTGRHWCDFISYSPLAASEIVWLRVERDEKEIQEIIEGCEKATEEIDQMVADLQKVAA